MSRKYQMAPDSGASQKTCGVKMAQGGAARRPRRFTKDEAEANKTS